MSARTLRVVLSGGEPRGPLLELLEALAPAEVSGLFVEDQALLRAAELPFVHEVSRLTRELGALEPRELERQLRAQASAARGALERAAARARATCSFAAVRGRAPTLALEAAGDFDLVLLAPLARPARASGPVFLRADDSPAGARARAAADELARAQRVPVLVVREADALQRAAAGRARALVVSVDDALRDARALRAELRCPLLVVR